MKEKQASKKEEWMLKDQTKERAMHFFQKIDVKKEILKMVIYVQSRCPSSSERFFFLGKKVDRTRSHPNWWLTL